MSYESRVYHKPTDFGPDPVVVLVVEGTHDVSRFAAAMNGMSPTVEQLHAGSKLARQLRRDQGGRAALALLAEHGGPDFRGSVPGVDEWVLRVLRLLAEGRPCAGWPGTPGCHRRRCPCGWPAPACAPERPRTRTCWRCASRPD